MPDGSLYQFPSLTYEKQLLLPSSFGHDTRQGDGSVPLLPWKADVLFESPSRWVLPLGATLLCCKNCYVYLLTSSSRMVPTCSSIACCNASPVGSLSAYSHTTAWMFGNRFDMCIRLPSALYHFLIKEDLHCV